MGVPRSTVNAEAKAAKKAEAMARKEKAKAAREQAKALKAEAMALKAEAKALREARKKEKPEEVMKRMRLEISQDVEGIRGFGNFANLCKTKLSEQATAAASLSVSSTTTVPRSIVWTLDGEVTAVVVIVPTDDMVKYACTLRDRQQGKPSPAPTRRSRSLSGGTSFEEYAQRVMDACGKAGVVIFALAGSPFRETYGKGKNAVVKMDIDRVICKTDLEGIKTWLCKGQDDLATYVYNMSRSLSEKPQRDRKAEESLGFDADSFKQGSVAVNKDGLGLHNLYLKQLETIRGVSFEMAKCVAKKYPSVKRLIEAFEKCATEREGMALLADLEYSSGPEGISKKKRFGPSASRNVYNVFMSEDPDCLI